MVKIGLFALFESVVMGGSGEINSETKERRDTAKGDEESRSPSIKVRASQLGI